MLISTKGRYALRVMIDLAEHRSDGFIPLKVIAERQEISEKYLENIIKLLVKACPRASECRTLSMWQGLGKLITEYFENITLADLMRRAPDGYDYVI